MSHFSRKDEKFILERFKFWKKNPRFWEFDHAEEDIFYLKLEDKRIDDPCYVCLNDPDKDGKIGDFYHGDLCTNYLQVDEDKIRLCCHFSRGQGLLVFKHYKKTFLPENPRPKKKKQLEEDEDLVLDPETELRRLKKDLKDFLLECYVEQSDGKMRLMTFVADYREWTKYKFLCCHADLVNHIRTILERKVKIQEKQERFYILGFEKINGD